MGHSWDTWGQKMVTNLHKQQQRETQNPLISLIYFVNSCYQLNISRVSKTVVRLTRTVGSNPTLSAISLY
jgi:hypothetical protein